MMLLLFAQLLTGLTTIFFQWPLLIAVLHNGGAAGLVLAAVTLLVRLGAAGKSGQGVLSSGSKLGQNGHSSPDRSGQSGFRYNQGLPKIENHV